MLEHIVDYLLCALIDAGHTKACAIQSISSGARLCRGERVGLGRCKGFALHRSAPFQALDACACPAVPLVMLAPGVWQVHQAARHISGPISGTYGQQMPQWAHSSALVHLPMVYQHRPASQSVWLGPGVCIRASILQTGQIVKTIDQHSAQAIVARHGTPCPERTTLDTRVPPMSVRQQPCPYTWTRLQYAFPLKTLCNPRPTAIFRPKTLHRTS